MTCHIRRAEVADLPEVYSFERDYIQEIEPAEEQRWANNMQLHLRQWITNLPQMFIAIQEHELAGHCFWQIEGTTAVLASIYVAPSWRRHGCGSALLERFERDAMNRGFMHLTLGVHQANPAQKLYRRAGYQPTHTSGSYDFYQKLVEAQSAQSEEH